MNTIQPALTYSGAPIIFAKPLTAAPKAPPGPQGINAGVSGDESGGQKSLLDALTAMLSTGFDVVAAIEGGNNSQGEQNPIGQVMNILA